MRLKLTERVCRADRQSACVGGGKRSETRISLIDCVIGAACQFWACQDHAAAISRPLRPYIVFQKEDDPWNKSETWGKGWSDPQIGELKVSLVVEHLMQDQGHALLFLL